LAHQASKKPPFAIAVGSADFLDGVRVSGEVGGKSSAGDVNVVRRIEGDAIGIVLGHCRRNRWSIQRHLAE